MPADAGGVPLVARTGPANRRDDGKSEELLEAFPVLSDGGAARTVRVQPKSLMGDRGHGFASLIAIVMPCGILSLLSPRGRGKPRGGGLGKHRYVAERTLGWWGRFRRIGSRYERKGEHFQGFNALAACVTCANELWAAVDDRTPAKTKPG